MTDAIIIRALCSNNGSMRYCDLTDTYLSGEDGQMVNIGKSLLDNGEQFLIFPSNSEKRVIAKTKVRLCKAKNCEGCENLHLCKKFLLGDCPFGKKRRPCRFGHDLESGQNANVLARHHLHLLTKNQLCILLMQNDNSLLPPVCHSYNNGVGPYGRCEEAEACRRLHICERYLLGGECSCPRAHDFYEPHPYQTLQDRGVSPSLISVMKDIYSNIEAMRAHNRGRTSQHAGGSNRGGAGNGRGSNGTNQAQGTTKDKTEICMYFVKGNCKHGDRCWKFHSTLPYMWQMRNGTNWSPLTDNEEVEKEYCDPSKTYSKGLEPVCFDTMTRGARQVQRLSTCSSVLQPDFVLTTTWAWFWEDENSKWIQYGTALGGRSVSDITSEMLEKKYQEEPHVVFEFRAGSQVYELSFQDMIQTNKRYGTKRLVRRRPIFVSAADAQTIKKSKKVPNSTDFKSLPTHWDRALTPDTGYKRVALASTSVEYMQIQRLMSVTLRGVSITSMERIQNKALWEIYQWQKDLMKRKNGGRDVGEKQLFHGTDPKHVDAICLNNFDWRICGTHGTAYGKGSYFARDARYSHSYTGDIRVRCMFVCQVLVGDYTRGDGSYLRPPSKDGGDTIFYDSCVDDASNPSIFVVFEKHQVYPQYLIKYSDQDLTSSFTPQRAYVPKANPQRQGLGYTQGMGGNRASSFASAQATYPSSSFSSSTSSSTKDQSSCVVC